MGGVVLPGSMITVSHRPNKLTGRINNREDNKTNYLGIHKVIAMRTNISDNSLAGCQRESIVRKLQ